MVRYFERAPAEDAVWALYFRAGRRLKRLLTSKQLNDWTIEATGLPQWLLDECYAAVGDGAETIALLVDPGLSPDAGEDVPLHRWVLERLLPLRELDDEALRAQVLGYWRGLPRRELFLLNKLL